MTAKVRARKLARLERRRIVATLNTLRWAEYTMAILKEQLALAKEGQQRQILATRIGKLRKDGIFKLLKVERDEALRKALNPGAQP